MTHRNRTSTRPWRLRRAITPVVLGAVSALVLGACASTTTAGTTTQQAAGSATPTAQTSAPWKIGISLSLSGDFADAGKAAERGYQTWSDVVNAAGGILGRKVELKIVDDTSSPNQVITNYQNLITKDHVDFVFGPFSSLLTVPAGQVAQRYGYALLEPAGGGPKVFQQHLNNLFFVQPAPVVAQGEVFAKYILSLPAAQRPKTAAYPALDDPFASPIADQVRQMFEKAGIKTVYAHIYPPETTDLTPIAAKIAAAKPDVVVGGTQSEDAYNMVKAFLQLHFTPKWLYLSNGANDPLNFPDKVGVNNINGIFSASDWFPTSTTYRSQEFVQAYLKKFGGSADQIDPTSAEAFSCGVLLEDVAKKAGKLDNATVISSLHSGTWSSPEGDLQWDADGAPTNSSFTLVQWIDHKLLPVYPADRAQHAPLVAPGFGG